MSSPPSSSPSTLPSHGYIDIQRVEDCHNDTMLQMNFVGDLETLRSMCLRQFWQTHEPDKETGTGPTWAALSAGLFLLFGALVVTFAVKYRRADYSLGVGGGSGRRRNPLVAVVDEQGVQLGARRKNFRRAPKHQRRDILAALNAETTTPAADETVSVAESLPPTYDEAVRGGHHCV